jgi:hypothetical protein
VSADVSDRALRAAGRRRARDAASGAGPAPEVGPPPRWPGAANKFVLFGEVMQVGILVTLLSLPLVTLPLALAAGVRHLRRFLAADGSRLTLFWADVRHGLGRKLLFGLAVVAVAVVLAIDIAVAGTGALPGGQLVAAAGWVGLAALGLLVLGYAGAWQPGRTTRSTLRAAVTALTGDRIGAAYLLACLGFTVIVTWQLLPLIIPALGCVALAIVAIPERKRAVAPREP